MELTIQNSDGATESVNAEFVPGTDNLVAVCPVEIDHPVIPMAAYRVISVANGIWVENESRPVELDTKEQADRFGQRLYELYPYLLQDGIGKLIITYQIEAALCRLEPLSDVHRWAFGNKLRAAADQFELPARQLFEALNLLAKHSSADEGEIASNVAEDLARVLECLEPLIESLLESRGIVEGDGDQ